MNQTNLPILSLRHKEPGKMRSLSAIELLNVWEIGLNKTLLEKSLQLLAVACSSKDIHEMAVLSIGERDARLLQLREWLFGSRLINMANCPECKERVEWETNIGNMRFQSLEQRVSGKVFTLDMDGYNIRFRLPNSYDLSKATSNSSYQSNPTKLLFDCILEVQRGVENQSADDLPDKLLKILNQRLEEEDPQANIQMLIDCPNCSQKWETQFDIVSYLWIEVDNWAKHMLHEVYLLARAFGWSEKDILSMSPQRRQLYLEMVRS